MKMITRDDKELGGFKRANDSLNAEFMKAGDAVYLTFYENDPRRSQPLFLFLSHVNVSELLINL